MRICSLQFLILKKKSTFITTALFLTFTNLRVCMLFSVCLFDSTLYTCYARKTRPSRDKIGI